MERFLSHTQPLTNEASRVLTKHCAAIQSAADGMHGSQLQLLSTSTLDRNQLAAVIQELQQLSETLVKIKIQQRPQLKVRHIIIFSHICIQLSLVGDVHVE